MKTINEKCDRCNCNDCESDHVCPYKNEINDDDETLCNCCDACKDECLMSI